MKQLARALTPPLLWRAGARLFGGSGAPAMFSGVFQSFSDVEDMQPWSREPYLAASRQLLREVQAGRLPPKSETTHALLALLINTDPGTAAPTVLDWAGGTGVRYWALRPALKRDVRWHVVDNPVLATISSEVMGISPQLSFAVHLPDAHRRFDIVIVYSSLQYVDDQAGMLRSLLTYRPRHLILSRLMAHEGPGYVTRQTLHGVTTPCRVASLPAVAATMRTAGYRPALAVTDGLDLSGYFDGTVPADLRVGPEHLLVFRAADA